MFTVQSPLTFLRSRRCTVSAQTYDTFARVSGSSAGCRLVSGRTFYSSPGSRWLTVHNLRHWMINGKKAHFIHRPAYLSAAHWYSCWKCGEKHSWTYGCRLHGGGVDGELSFLASVLLTEATFCLWCSQVERSGPPTWQLGRRQLGAASFFFFLSGGCKRPHYFGEQVCSYNTSLPPAVHFRET